MKHNFIGNDVKKIALDEYLEGNATMTQVSDKYKICMNTFSAYKRKHMDYVNDYTIYLANQKSGIPSEKPILNTTKKPRKPRAKKEIALNKEIDEIIRETEERKERENKEMSQPKPKPLETPKPKPLETPKPKPLEMPKPKPLEMPKPKPLEMPKPTPLEVPKPKPLEVPHKNNGLHVQPAPRPSNRNEIFNKPSEPVKHNESKHDNLKFTKPHTVKPQENSKQSKSFKIVSYEDEITRLINGS